MAPLLAVTGLCAVVPTGIALSIADDLILVLAIIYAVYVPELVKVWTQYVRPPVV
jgi:hypothetical protein